MGSLNSETQMVISVAAKPGNFGTTIHNAAYKYLGINYLYKSFCTANIEDAIRGVRALGIRGCSVSMPFKQPVVSLLDELDASASEIGAVNTVVNNNGVLKGYNTDVYGAKKALEKINTQKTDSVLVLGAGGVARAIIHALADIGVTDIYISNRSPAKTIDLEQKYNCKIVPWAEVGSVPTQILINATSIGMESTSSRFPINLGAQKLLRAVFDVVVSPMDTHLISMAEKLGMEVSPGYYMSLHQAAAQFKLYTGMEPPLAYMETCIKELLV